MRWKISARVLTLIALMILPAVVQVTARAETLVACRKGQRIRLRSHCGSKETVSLDVAAEFESLNDRLTALETDLGPQCGASRYQCNGRCPRARCAATSTARAACAYLARSAATATSTPRPARPRRRRHAAEERAHLHGPAASRLASATADCNAGRPPPDATGPAAPAGRPAPARPAPTAGAAPTPGATAPTPRPGARPGAAARWSRSGSRTRRAARPPASC